MDRERSSLPNFPLNNPMHRARYIIFLLSTLASCSSYYELNYEFNRNFERGKIADAENVLDQNKNAERSKNRFLYFANRGVVTHLLGKYEESNNWLEEAYIFGEDYRKNSLNIVGSYLLNPSVIVYPGEDHEHLMLLYYKALNYLKLKEYDKALVECRRLNNRLNDLGDKYKSDSRYRKDAFIHNLMGIIYDASGDYNNAFIAYRNSLNIYRDEYQRLFNLNAPNQLKEDLLRTAALAGFFSDLQGYEKEFGYKYQNNVSKGGDLVFFWHNGLAPIKDEWSMTFAAIEGEGGQVVFQNDEFGFNFPFFYNMEDREDGIRITDLSGFRVAFPKYVERVPYFNYGDLEVNGNFFTLEKAEDINAIAFKTLNERMLEEFGKGLLRVATKKALEKQARKEDDVLGLLVGAFNVASEKADTRNWQTLPHTIHYTRVPLKLGENIVEIYTDGPRSEASEKFNFTGKSRTTQFHTYQSLESDIAF